MIRCVLLSLSFIDLLLCDVEYILSIDVVSVLLFLVWLSAMELMVLLVFRVPSVTVLAVVGCSVNFNGLQASVRQALHSSLHSIKT